MFWQANTGKLVLSNAPPPHTQTPTPHPLPVRYKHTADPDAPREALPVHGEGIGFKFQFPNTYDVDGVWWGWMTGHHDTVYKFVVQHLPKVLLRLSNERIINQILFR